MTMQPQLVKTTERVVVVVVVVQVAAREREEQMIMKSTHLSSCLMWRSLVITVSARECHNWTALIRRIVKTAPSCVEGTMRELA